MGTRSSERQVGSKDAWKPLFGVGYRTGSSPTPKSSISTNRISNHGPGIWLYTNPCRRISRPAPALYSREAGYWFLGIFAPLAQVKQDAALLIVENNADATLLRVALPDRQAGLPTSAPNMTLIIPNSADPW